MEHHEHEGNGHEALATDFEANRAHLRSVAYRILGSTADAEDAVQETWLRLSRTGGEGVENLGGWLTTVATRVCLDMMRSRRRREESALDEPGAGSDESTDPGHEVEVAEGVGLAMLVVLEALTPAERVSFVLHDLFDLPYDEIAPIVERTPEAARQLASRARRRVRGARPGGVADPIRQREIVGAFLSAAKGGDLGALVELLDPDVVLRSDAAALATGAPPEVRGAQAVAETFAGRAQAARPALVGGDIGLVWAPGGVARVAFAMTFGPDAILAIEIIADRERLADLDPVVLSV